MSESLSKEERLKGSKVVSEIFGGQKKSVHSFPFRAFYSIETSRNPSAKFGVSVPKKKFKRAVDRNRIKRLVKEALRINKTILLNELYKQSVTVNVMIICNLDSLPSFNFIEIKIKDLLKRLAQVAEVYEKK